MIPKNPINKQAAMILSRGELNPIKTIEQAMSEVWKWAAQPEGQERIRGAIERGVESVEYRIKIYKRGNGLPGFNVKVYYQEGWLHKIPINFNDLL